MAGFDVRIDEAGLKQLTTGRDGAVWLMLERLGVQAENSTKRLLSMPGSGRAYRKGGGRGRGHSGGVIHVASSPGSPPAVNTGRLRASVTHEVGGPVYSAAYGIGLVLRVGTNVVYGRYLETGTRHMAQRPWLVRGVSQALAGIG